RVRVRPGRPFTADPILIRRQAVCRVWLKPPARCCVQSNSGGNTTPGAIRTRDPAPTGDLAGVERPPTEPAAGASRVRRDLLRAFDYVNERAQLQLVGITPGAHQMHVGLTQARKDLRAGLPLPTSMPPRRAIHWRSSIPSPEACPGTIGGPMWLPYYRSASSCPV